MNIYKSLGLLLSALGTIALVGCGGDDDGGGEAAATTYTLSGTMGQNASSSGFGVSSMIREFKEIVGLKMTRTQCNDDFFYDVYCVSFGDVPVVAKGDVDCTGGGGFSVAGLPIGEAVGCFVRRYTAADGTDGSTVGAIQIPAANLNGKTSQMVATGDVEMEIEFSEDGTINATVVGPVNETVDDALASEFTDTAINGVWALKCTSTKGGDDISVGHCKCFLDEEGVDNLYSGDESACIADDASLITGDVELGVGIYVYNATVGSGGIPIDDNHTIAEGATIHGITIWGTSGSAGNYVSLKAGGEGASDHGGKLTWDTTTTDDPTAAVTWATSIDPDGAITAITIPTVPSADDNQGAWFTWAAAVTTNAVAAGMVCNQGPTNPAQHVWCINQAMDLIGDSDSASTPRVWINPFCDQNGCVISTDTGEFSGNDGSTSAFLMARLEVEGLHFNYEDAGTWTSSSNYSTLVSEETIGIEPGNRFVFEPLEFFPNGAGFRQRDSDERHYRCGSSTHEVQNDACHDTNDHYELVCHTSKELSISFFGATSPMSVLFDNSESVGYARLVKHDGSGSAEITPQNDKTAVEMCIDKSAGGSGIFYATGVKQ